MEAVYRYSVAIETLKEIIDFFLHLLKIALFQQPYSFLTDRICPAQNFYEIIKKKQLLKFIDGFGRVEEIIAITPKMIRKIDQDDKNTSKFVQSTSENIFNINCKV